MLTNNVNKCVNRATNAMNSEILKMTSGLRALKALVERQRERRREREGAREECTSESRVFTDLALSLKFDFQTETETKFTRKVTKMADKERGRPEMRPIWTEPTVQWRIKAEESQKRDIARQKHRFVCVVPQTRDRPERRLLGAESKEAEIKPEFKTEIRKEIKREISEERIQRREEKRKKLNSEEKSRAKRNARRVLGAESENSLTNARDLLTDHVTIACDNEKPILEINADDTHETTAETTAVTTAETTAVTTAETTSLETTAEKHVKEEVEKTEQEVEQEVKQEVEERVEVDAKTGSAEVAVEALLARSVPDWDSLCERVFRKALEVFPRVSAVRERVREIRETSLSDDMSVSARETLSSHEMFRLTSDLDEDDVNDDTIDDVVSSIRSEETKEPEIVALIDIRREINAFLTDKHNTDGNGPPKTPFRRFLFDLCLESREERPLCERFCEKWRKRQKPEEIEEEVAERVFAKLRKNSRKPDVRRDGLMSFCRRQKARDFVDQVLMEELVAEEWRWTHFRPETEVILEKIISFLISDFIHESLLEFNKMT